MSRCHVHVGKYLFGVDVSPCRRWSGAADHRSRSRLEIAGLINLRGEVLTAIDLRARLGLPSTDSSREPVNVVVRVDDEPVSLLVDEIGGVLEVSQVPFEQTPSTVGERVRDLLLGAYTLPDRLLLALNARQVLDVGQDNRAA
jgi:purine-binding chemotaxis protein CheW